MNTVDRICRVLSILKENLDNDGVPINELGEAAAIFGKNLAYWDNLIALIHVDGLIRTHGERGRVTYCITLAGLEFLKRYNR